MFRVLRSGGRNLVLEIYLMETGEFWRFKSIRGGTSSVRVRDHAYGGASGTKIGRTRKRVGKAVPDCPGRVGPVIAQRLLLCKLHAHMTQQDQMSKQRQFLWGFCEKIRRLRRCDHMPSSSIPPRML